MPTTGLDATLPVTSPAPFIEHTLLAATATPAEIRRLCEEAVEWGFAAVCVPPRYVPLAAELVYGSEVCVVSVCGFPLGYATPRCKAYEASEAVRLGAAEIDLVIQLGAALAGELELVREELTQVVRALAGHPLKVILECCYLSDPLKRDLVEVAVEAGAAFVKTSTGFGSGGATIADVQLLAAAARGRIGIKAAGGIRELGFCRQLLAAGASRIGTSSGVALLREWQAQSPPHLPA